MPFNTRSYLAGVGTVVAAIAIGFSGGFLLAPSTDYMEQNRLQRVTSSAPIANPAPQAAIAVKQEITEARLIPLVTAAAAVPSPQQPARSETIPVMSRAIEPAPTPAASRAAEPARAASEDDAAKPDVNMSKLRAAEAKAERKRAREQRSIERRKQREIALATVAMRRMLRDRDPQQVADRTESSRFGFFGED